MKYVRNIDRHHPSEFPTDIHAIRIADIDIKVQYENIIINMNTFIITSITF